MSCIRCISTAIKTQGKQSADSKRTLRLLGINILGHLSISRLYIKIEFDSQNNVLVENFWSDFALEVYHLWRRRLWCWLPPRTFLPPKMFFLHSITAFFFSFKFSDGNWKCQVSDVLKVLSCIVLSVHKTLILTFFRSKRRRLKETGLNWHKCCKLNKTNMLSAKISREFEKSGIFCPSTM